MEKCLLLLVLIVALGETSKEELNLGVGAPALNFTLSTPGGENIERMENAFVETV